MGGGPGLGTMATWEFQEAGQLQELCHREPQLLDWFKVRSWLLGEDWQDAGGTRRNSSPGQVTKIGTQEQRIQQPQNNCTNIYLVAVTSQVLC